MRVRHWAHFLLLPLAGFDPFGPLVDEALSLARGSIIAVCVLAYGYLLNGLSDRALDRAASKNPFVGARGGGAHLALPYAALFILSLLALSLAWRGPLSVLIATLAALAAGTLYSVGPRLKVVPVIGTLMNVACFAPLLFVGLGRSGLAPALLSLAVCFVGLLVQNQLIHEAADAREDRAASVRTTFVTYGPRVAGWLAFASAIVATAGAWSLLGALAALVIMIPFVPFFPYALATRGTDRDAMRRLRLTHRAAAAVAGALLYGASILFA